MSRGGGFWSVFKFTKGQLRGMLWLLPLLVIVVVVLWAVNRTKVEVKSVVEVASGALQESVGVDSLHLGDRSRESEGEIKKPLSEPKLHDFDPNTVSIQELVQFGFSAKTAAGIIKYREKGKRFEIPEDFATCYGVTIEQYTKVEPYIKIGKEYRVEKFAKRATPQGADTVKRDEPMAEVEREITLLEINSADSTQLRSVVGIGEYLVVEIIKYRDALGGFAAKEQLAEIKGMYEANYERICEQIYVENCDIKKIDINFASQKTLVEQWANHPYVTSQIIRKTLKQRQLRGGWSSTEEMIEQNILTKEEAEKLAPYILFRDK